MRDDLHHSLPQTHVWRKVVQVACAPGLGGDLVDTLTRAAWARADWMKEAWGKEFLQVLATQQVELFGTEQMEQKLSALEAWCPPLTRVGLLTSHSPKFGAAKRPVT